MLRTTLISVAAIVALFAGVVPANAVEHRDYVGGYWVKQSFEVGNAIGSNSSVQNWLWMDRATSNNPSTWDGWIGAAKDHYLTARVPHGNYWWRTCYEYKPGSVYCGKWYHA